MRFAVAAALAQHFQAAFVRVAERDGEALRKEVVPGVTGGDLDLIGLARGRRCCW
jgi:hypothetical protein